MKNIKTIFNNETTKKYVSSPEMESSFDMITKQLLPLVMEANSKILYQDLQENLVLTENSTMEDVQNIFEKMREDVRVDTVNLMESITDLYSDVSLTNEEKDAILAEAVDICFEVNAQDVNKFANVKTPIDKSTRKTNQSQYNNLFQAKKWGDSSSKYGQFKTKVGLMGKQLGKDIRATQANFLANKANGSSNIKALGQTFGKVGSVVGKRVNTGFNQTRKTLISSFKPTMKPKTA